MNHTIYEILSAYPSTGEVGNDIVRAAVRAQIASSLCFDSRLAVSGAIFFCLVGKTSDGHRFAPAAYRAGCRVFVVERPIELPADALQWVVDNSRHALADCAAAFYDHPEREVRLVGLTGTKGKTTTAILTRYLLTTSGIPAGYIGTNGVDFANCHYSTLNSTPESLDIYRYLRQMADAGIRACIMEISSQALWMERIRGLVFDSTLFTNLSRDHIGGVEHPDMEHYRASKRRLFTDYPARATILNGDDPAAVYMANGATASTVLSFSVDESAKNFVGVNNTYTRTPLWTACALRPGRLEGRIGTFFDVFRDGLSMGYDWFIPLPGRFNVQNALAALSVVCERFGVPPAKLRKRLAMATVPGRFETVRHPAVPDVIFVIDYAHNGISMASILDALRVYEPTRLIALFGSVGGRTRERRRDLALAAARRADLCILTSDNPADEPPMDILHDIDTAFPPDACPRILEPDRAEAIRLAVDMAEPGDIILLAGKGHEDYQLIGTRHIPFSELRVLEDAFLLRESRMSFR